MLLEDGSFNRIRLEIVLTRYYQGFGPFSTCWAVEFCRAVGHSFRKGGRQPFIYKTFGRFSDEQSVD